MAARSGEGALPRIAVVGCGGLGVPATMALVLGGATRLRLLDDDRVELSNLHRQVLYPAAEVGRDKALSLRDAALRLAARQGLPEPDVEIRTGRIDAQTCAEALQGCDAAVEGTDDAPVKFVVNDWAVAAEPESPRFATIAAAIGRRGQWMTVAPGGACYRCLFEEPPPAELLATCRIAGVIGPVVGQVGALAARSLLRALRGRPDPARSALVRRLATGFATTPVARAPDCPCQRLQSTTVERIQGGARR